MITNIEQLKIAALDTDKNIFMAKYREVFSMLKKNGQSSVKISKFNKNIKRLSLFREE